MFDLSVQLSPNNPADLAEAVRLWEELGATHTYPLVAKGGKVIPSLTDWNAAVASMVVSAGRRDYLGGVASACIKHALAYTTTGTILNRSAATQVWILLDGLPEARAEKRRQMRVHRGLPVADRDARPVGRPLGTTVLPKLDRLEAALTAIRDDPCDNTVLELYRALGASYQWLQKLRTSSRLDEVVEAIRAGSK